MSNYDYHIKAEYLLFSGISFVQRDFLCSAGFPNPAALSICICNAKLLKL